MIDILVGDCLETLRTLPDASVQCCVTSPPYYGLRDYGHEGQIGLEETPDAYVARLVEVFRDVRRVLCDDGTLWLNLGDSYASPTKGSGGTGKARLGPNRDLQNAEFQKFAPRRFGMGDAKQKDLLMIPAQVAIALRADGWFLRSDIIWHKPNPMPESIRDRPTSAHEHVFLLSKSLRYFYDGDAIREAFADARQGRDGSKKASERDRGGREDGFTKPNGIDPSHLGGKNARNVWMLAPQPFSGAHFATMPPALVERCLKAGSRPGDTVLDPFGGAGTTALVAEREGRNSVMCELNPAYVRIAKRRLGLPLTLAERLADLDVAMTELRTVMEAA